MLKRVSKSFSKSWQSIIASPPFCNLQFNTNLYENDIIMEPLDNSFQGFIIKSLESTKFQYFDLNQFDKFGDFGPCWTDILGVKSGLIFYEIEPGPNFPKQFVVCNPATKQLIELLKLDWDEYRGLTSDLLVDLQSNTYKIFLLHCHKAHFLTLYVYNSITNMWQSLDSFSKFQSNYQVNLDISNLKYYYLRKIFTLYLKQGPMD
jgi:hypothetical protein